MKKVSKAKKWSFWGGLTIVVATHLYLIGFGLPANQIAAHAVINLVAGALLVYGWLD